MSTHANDGGPAYPVPYMNGELRGMSLRDYFAASAPDQIGDDPDAEWTAKTCGIEMPEPRGTPAEWRAFWIRCEAILRYRYADAMLRAREASNG